MNRSLFIFILMWLSALMIMLSPVLADEASDEAKPWIVSALVLILIPFTLNLIARGGYKRLVRLGDFGTDHKYILLACAISYAIASIFISSVGEVKQQLRKFGKDIRSTGKSLALLIPAFIGGLTIANLFVDDGRYIFRVVGI
ncbi:MAG: hypothetical protein CL407_11115 [Acidimicrobiaceae bacterium]|nr:hypothetical protein [Acidimicrobiaceae bacterium]